jgi:hypothetical protein
MSAPPPVYPGPPPPPYAVAPPGQLVEVPIPPIDEHDLWSERDMPTFPWSVGKGVAKAVAMFFLIVLIPVELLSTVLAPSVIPIKFPLSTSFLEYGGTAVAVFSGAATATFPTRVYGLFRFLSSLVKLLYLLALAVVGVIVIGVQSFSITFGFSDLIYLFMIGTGLACLAGLITLYEDLRHPGDRLPYDFPLSKRVEREREQAYLAAKYGPPAPPSAP